MAKISKEEVLNLAKLAKLQLTEDEVLKFTDEISSILTYIEQLNSVDVSDLKPTNQVTGLTNVMREDEIVDYGVSNEELFKNVPSTKDGHIQVKRMLT